VTDDVVLVEVDAAVALVTLNRPEARNAISRQLLGELRRVMTEIDGDDGVRAVVLTGADPAFCAGLDLKELGRDGGPLNDPPPATGGGAPGDAPATGANDRAQGNAPATGAGDDISRRSRSPLVTDKPIVGAVNGPAVTGGLELALNCDFLVASERARFADTHARIGVQPLWGLTVLLPQAVGLRRAKEMSSTGNFVDAGTAFEWGLVNHVVPHDQLVATALRLAGDIANNDPHALSTLLDTYRRGSLATAGEAWRIERRAAATFHGPSVDPAEIERRRQSVVERGRSQL
jgi:enoyl-CoA hydratase